MRFCCGKISATSPIWVSILSLKPSAANFGLSNANFTPKLPPLTKQPSIRSFPTPAENLTAKNFLREFGFPLPISLIKMLKQCCKIRRRQSKELILKCSAKQGSIGWKFISATTAKTPSINTSPAISKMTPSTRLLNISKTMSAAS